MDFVSGHDSYYGGVASTSHPSSSTAHQYSHTSASAVATDYKSAPAAATKAYKSKQVPLGAASDSATPANNAHRHQAPAQRLKQAVTQQQPVKQKPHSKPRAGDPYGLRASDDYYEATIESSHTSHRERRASFAEPPAPEVRHSHLEERDRRYSKENNRATNREKHASPRKPHDRFITGPDADSGGRRRSRSARRSCRTKNRSPSNSYSDEYESDEYDDRGRRRRSRREHPVGARPHRQKKFLLDVGYKIEF